MERKFIMGIIFATLAILGIGIFFFSEDSSSKNPALKNSAELLKVTEYDWVKGDKEAKVTLIEYSDFQCPACGAYNPVVKQLIHEIGDKIVFAYRSFPLRQIHQNAQIAAQAAETAGRQGKFWKMHDMLFENQKEWSSHSNAKEIFIKYAQSLNLDVEQFKNDLDSKEVEEKVDNDYRRGVSLGVNTTPTFFLNGEKLDNTRSYREFKDMVQKAVSQNQ